MCTDRIEETAKKAGAVSAVYSLEDQQLIVGYNPKKTNKDKIINAIVAVGHDAAGKKADDAVYNNLPGCCHYRAGNEAEVTHDAAPAIPVVISDTLTVQGACGMCKTRIEETARKAGAQAANWNGYTKKLAITYNREMVQRLSLIHI